VLAGLGFAIASEWVFAPELKSGAVISILDDWSLPAVDLSAVFPAGRQASAKARAFASFVEAEMSKAECAGQELSRSVSSSRIGSSASGDRPGRVSHNGIAGLVAARIGREREIGAEKRAPGSAKRSLAA
jgi:hypothetical protein